jgi:hypothetical protein
MEMCELRTIYNLHPSEPHGHFRKCELLSKGLKGVFFNHRVVFKRDWSRKSAPDDINGTSWTQRKRRTLPRSGCADHYPHDDHTPPSQAPPTHDILVIVIHWRGISGNPLLGARAPDVAVGAIGTEGSLGVLLYYAARLECDPSSSC